MIAEHAWFEVGFSFTSYLECECGFRPTSQEEMDEHTQDTGTK